MVLIVLLAAAVGACGEVESLLSTEAGPEEESSDVGLSSTHTKKIKQTASRASVVLDKNCPDMVQPYELSDNVASLLRFKVEEVAKSVWDNLPTVFSGRLPTGRDQSNNWESLKNAANQLNWLPMAAEVRYGEESHKEETNVLDRDSKGGTKNYPVADGMLKEILASVGQRTDYNFQLFILKNDKRNAVARPGGFLYIDEGLLKDKTKRPKAYFALAHEVAHVLQRHETQATQSMIIDSISGTDDFINIAKSVKGNPDVILGHVKTGKNVFIRYHIDQELQADSCAARMLSGVFQDEKDLVRSLNAFIEDLPPPEPEKPRGPKACTVEGKIKLGVDIVNTPIEQHPNDSERQRNLQQMYAEITKEKRKGREIGGQEGRAKRFRIKP